MEKFTDLRFIIGLFFTVVGVSLVILGVVAASDKTFGRNLNLYSGLAMLTFGLFMLWLNQRAWQKENNPS
jgi:hypothetical protein